MRAEPALLFLRVEPLLTLGTFRIYFIFPRSHQEKEGLPIQAQLGPHLDATSAQVQAAIYLDEVGPHAGGFTLWPTSPQQLYPCMRQHHNFTPTEDFGPTLKHIKQSVVPIEFAGGVGDVILCECECPRIRGLRI
eukprot:COSAG04_NODE_385_length_15323_cov_3.045586_8_plen_135_part_00